MTKKSLVDSLNCKKQADLECRKRTLSKCNGYMEFAEVSKHVHCSSFDLSNILIGNSSKEHLNVDNPSCSSEYSENTSFFLNLTVPLSWSIEQKKSKGMHVFYVFYIFYCNGSVFESNLLEIDSSYTSFVFKGSHEFGRLYKDSKLLFALFIYHTSLSDYAKYIQKNKDAGNPIIFSCLGTVELIINQLNDVNKIIVPIKPIVTESEILSTKIRGKSFKNGSVDDELMSIVMPFAIINGCAISNEIFSNRLYNYIDIRYMSPNSKLLRECVGIFKNSSFIIYETPMHALTQTSPIIEFDLTKDIEIIKNSDKLTMKILVYDNNNCFEHILALNKTISGLSDCLVATKSISNIWSTQFINSAIDDILLTEMNAIISGNPLELYKKFPISLNIACSNYQDTK